MGIAAIIEELTHRVYGQPLDAIARSCVFAALIFCTLFRKYSGRRWLRPCIGAALAVWFGAVLWMTLLSRSAGGTYESSWIPLHTYWKGLIGEQWELIRSAYMNVVLFYPAGLLLAGLMPEGWSFRKGLLCTVLAFALFSLTIELIQHFWQLGNCEIDDVLHNTLGAGVGFAAFGLDVDIEPEKNGQSQHWR